MSKLDYSVMLEEGHVILLPPYPLESRGNLAEPDVHAESATQLYPIGTLLWYPGLGKKYRYSKAGTAHVHPRQLMYNGNLVPDAASHANEDGFYGKHQVDGSNVARAAGATELSFTDTINRVKDYYAGGYLIHWGADEYESSHIISGPAAPTVSTWQNTVVKLLRPKKQAVISGEDIQIWLNPYSNISTHEFVASGEARQFQTAMGVAELLIQDGFYFWLQTAGPVFVQPNGWVDNCPGYNPNKRMVYPIKMGGIITPQGVALQGDQVIGVLLSRTLDGSADAFINLDLDLGH